MLSASQVLDLCPLLAGDDILAGAFSPEDGHVTPEAVVAGYAYAARIAERPTSRTAEQLNS